MSIPNPEADPSGGEQKRAYVRDMFTAIAPRYDFLNHLLSLNIDRSWRRAAVDRLGWEKHPEGTYLDLCAGTLDLAAELAGRAGFQGDVVGADFVVPMLQLGRRKVDLPAVGADALQLPFGGDTFQGCTVGFGVRNLADLDAGFAEMFRVLRPGARMIVLEFCTPTFLPVRLVYLSYFRFVLPLVGRMLSKHDSAYKYLPDSVLNFPDPEQLSEMIGARGFVEVGHARLTAGISAIHWGTKP